MTAEGRPGEEAAAGVRAAGLVLGGGGVLGAAWMVGALQALEEETGLDARDFDAYVGTSAGAILVGLLGAGVAVADLSRTSWGCSSPPARWPGSTSTTTRQRRRPAAATQAWAGVARAVDPQRTSAAPAAAHRRAVGSAARGRAATSTPSER